jgi:hypothetical protein
MQKSSLILRYNISFSLRHTFIRLLISVPHPSFCFIHTPHVAVTVALCACHCNRFYEMWIISQGGYMHGLIAINISIILQPPKQYSLSVQVCRNLSIVTVTIAAVVISCRCPLSSPPPHPHMKQIRMIWSGCPLLPFHQLGYLILRVWWIWRPKWGIFCFHCHQYILVLYSVLYLCMCKLLSLTPHSWVLIEKLFMYYCMHVFFLWSSTVCNYGSLSVLQHISWYRLPYLL